MIPRIALAALLHAACIAAVCTKLEDCKQFEKLKTNDCQPYHHFLARGSTSPYPGHLIETVGKVCDKLNNATHPNACGYEDVEYPAGNGGDRWCQSAHEGALNGAAQMRNYTERCPDSHLIVFGFSQGGSVQLDVIGGGGGELWGCQQEANPGMDINTAPGSKIAAVVTFGATRRSANQPFTFGGGQVSNGAAPRTAEQNAGLMPYANADKLREYCQPRDIICAPETENKEMRFHLDYFDKWGNEVAEWVAGKSRVAAGIPANGVIPEPEKTSAASAMLKKGISHPISNIFMFIIVAFGL
ncbi:alpha/beta-hydrolase [Phaeosphaeriaceae sp. SRC1lsM3a]|nr:alpha/beta-hydrolase [Stagonospora sp. SRC1lsM3a]